VARARGLIGGGAAATGTDAGVVAAVDAAASARAHDAGAAVREPTAADAGTVAITPGADEDAAAQPVVRIGPGESGSRASGSGGGGAGQAQPCRCVAPARGVTI